MKILLLGCGKMGSALLKGWLEQGTPPDQVQVADPSPSEWLHQLATRGLRLNPKILDRPDVAVLAVKPQMIDQALPRLAQFAGQGTLFISVAAGTTVSTLTAALGGDAKVIRAMPNTPATIGLGATAYFADPELEPALCKIAEDLFQAVGIAVQVGDEAQMDAVTALSGSGPAYVFHMIEAMAKAGTDLGLAPETANQLALATVNGAAALAVASPQTVDQLRKNVTSPAGTTAAALDILMQDKTGLIALISKAMTAARIRSIQLARIGTGTA